MAKENDRLPVTHNDIVSGNLDYVANEAIRQASQSLEGKVSATALPYSIPDASVGPVNRQRTAMGSGGSFFQHGMSSGRAGSNTAFATGDYQDSTSAFGDVPLYFALMNENNGGIMYWPITLREKYSWYKYWYRTDPFVGAAIDMHTDLPLSRLKLRMPKLKDKEMGKKIEAKYRQMVARLKLFDHLQSVIHDFFLIGNCFPANHDVHTPNGPMSISEVREGDEVLSHDGEYHRVSAISRRKVNERLVSFDFAKLKAFDFTPTKEHPILVLRKSDIENGCYDPKFVSAKDVWLGDYVSIASSNKIKDVEKIDVLSRIKEIIDSKYKKVSVLGSSINVEYETCNGGVHKTDHVRDRLLEFLRGLESPVEIKCQELSEKLGIDDPAKLRSVAYSLRRKGIINSERVGASIGSAIRWYPYNGDSSDQYSNVSRKKSFDLKVSNLNIDDDFLYLLGYWLGDGWLWKNKRPLSHEFMALDICVDEKSPCMDRLRQCFDSVFGDQYQENHGSFCNDDLHHFMVDDPMFCEWWNNNFGSSSSNKKLPEWIMSLPTEKQIWILRGMIDSDGCVSETKSGYSVHIDSITKRMMTDLFQIGIRCGIPFSYRLSTGTSVLPRNGVHKEYKSYRLSVGHSEKIEALISGCVKEPSSYDFGSRPCNNIGFIEHNGKMYYKLDGVSHPHYEGYVYNLQVEGSHTYAVNCVDTHNCFIFIEWDDEKKEWQKLIMLPPEDVDIKPIPFTDKKIVRYQPEQLIQMIKGMIDDRGSFHADTGESDLDDQIEKEVRANIPIDIVEMVDKYGAIIFDTSPYDGDGESKVGSFVNHLARRRVPYLDLGVSIVERVTIPLLMKEHYKYTQLSLAMRNMTPKNKIAAENITPPQLDELREQVDLSSLDPDYTVMTNYSWEWEQIGAENRLLDLQREYEVIENQLFAGLGVTRELLTGDSHYSGSRINVEIMNTRYMLIREIIKGYVEESLFRPMAVANDWYELDENGEKQYIYPTLGFHRITIRDNQEVFDTLFQLYQKGSLPVDLLYEVLNIDSDEIHATLAHDLFTIKDAMFNDVVRQASGDVGTFLTENTDLNDRVAKYLNLKVTGGGGEDADMGGGFGGDEDAAPVESEFDDNLGLGYGIDDLVPTGITSDGIRKPFGIQNPRNPKPKSGPKLKQLSDMVQDKVSNPENRDEVRDAIRQIEKQESPSKEEQNV